MTVKEAAQVATGVVHGLKDQPLALALIVINVLFLVAGSWFLYTLSGISSENAARRDALLSQLAKDCIVVVPTPPAAK